MTDDVTLGEIHRTTQRIEGDLRHMRTDHEGRLRRVERWMYAIPATVVTAVSAAVYAAVR